MTHNSDIYKDLDIMTVTLNRSMCYWYSQPSCRNEMVNALVFRHRLLRLIDPTRINEMSTE